MKVSPKSVVECCEQSFFLTEHLRKKKDENQLNSSHHKYTIYLFLRMLCRAIYLS